MKCQDTRRLIKHLYRCIDNTVADMQYADHGAYGQGKDKVARLRREIAALEAGLKKENVT